MALLIVCGEILIELARLAGRSTALSVIEHPDADYLATSWKTYNIPRQDTKAGFGHLAQLFMTRQAHTFARNMRCGQCARLEETRSPEPDIKADFVAYDLLSGVSVPASGVSVAGGVACFAAS